MRILTHIIVALLALSTAVRAGRGDKTGTAAATELLIPVGARSIALGGACLATMTSIEAIHSNPAGLARAPYSTVTMVSHMTYLADIAVNYAAVSTTIANVATLALSIKSLSVGDIFVTTEDNPDGTGEVTSPTVMVIGGTLARRVSDRISVGITSNLIYERMAKVAATDIAFNVGLQYNGLGGIDGLNFGVVIKNLGPRMRYDGDGLIREAKVDDALRNSSPIKIAGSSSELPSTIEIGLGYMRPVLESNYVVLSATFQNNNFADDEYRFGGEYVMQNIFSFRAGYVYSSPEDGREYIYGLSTGIGIHTTLENVDIMTDYAYRAVKYFSGNHVVSLTVGF
ncbi:MAG: PorV/PorQ family protein [Ignavibacteriae bacterium]|nr:PorV/PorQ family protein [Ignavibacteria bacterium]MBI3363911.1 PorV/PorQ family protein [Ignavibacteriota bacterium]